jgi:hypothetical protein
MQMLQSHMSVSYCQHLARLKRPIEETL